MPVSCVCAFVCVCVCACVRESVCARVRECLRVQMCVRMHACTCECVYVRVRARNPTIDVLYGGAVVRGQGEVVRGGPVVERSHDGVGVVRVLQTQGVAQLMDRHQEQVVT